MSPTSRRDVQENYLLRMFKDRNRASGAGQVAAGWRMGRNVLVCYGLRDIAEGSMFQEIRDFLNPAEIARLVQFSNELPFVEGRL